jgi:hypothetical protein
MFSSLRRVYHRPKGRSFQRAHLVARFEPLEDRRLLSATVVVNQLFGGGNLGAEITDGDTTPSQGDGTDLGTTSLGDTPAQAVFRVTNTGDAALNVGSVQLPGGFSLFPDKDLPQTIDANGGFADFAFFRATNSSGTRSGDLSFSTNDPAHPAFNFTITGTVTAGTPTQTFSGVTTFPFDSDVQSTQGSDSAGNPVPRVQNRLIMFNLPAGQNNVKLDVAAQDDVNNSNADTGILLVQIINDSNGNGRMDV